MSQQALLTLSVWTIYVLWFSSFGTECLYLYFSWKMVHIYIYIALCTLPLRVSFIHCRLTHFRKSETKISLLKPKIFTETPPFKKMPLKMSTVRFVSTEVVWNFTCPVHVLLSCWHDDTFGAIKCQKPTEMWYQCCCFVSPSFIKPSSYLWLQCLVFGRFLCLEILFVCSVSGFVSVF